MILLLAGGPEMKSCSKLRRFYEKSLAPTNPSCGSFDCQPLLCQRSIIQMLERNMLPPTKQIHFLKRNKSKRGRARLPRGWLGQSITHALDLPPLADTCFSTPPHFSTLDEVLMVVSGLVHFFNPALKVQQCICSSSLVSAFVQLLMIATESVRGILAFDG